MEEQILAVDLSTEQTLEVNLPEQDNVAQIDVYWQDEVTLDLDLSLMYIVSGQREIQDYVDNKSKPEIDEYIELNAKPIVAKVVEQEAKPIIDEYFENTVKPSITEFAEEEMAGYAATATAQVALATEQAGIATAQAGLSEASALAAAATLTSVNNKAVEFDSTVNAAKSDIQSATSTSITNINNTVSAEIIPNLEGYVSSATNQASIATSKANEAQASASAAKTSEANAKTSEVNAKSYADSIEPERFLNKEMITNCITEIPQDIKLELNNGTLTLKAGSKVYVPNGSGVFNEVVITNDFTINVGAPNGQRFLFAKVVNSGSVGFFVGINENIFSGSSQPTPLTDVAYWYDTTNKVIKQTQDKGATWTTYTGATLPLASVNFDTGVVTNIDQVFNGFSYIGSTLFALPGVKGLIPNGRNADGSLKNIEFTYNEVKVATNTYPSVITYLALYKDGIVGLAGKLYTVYEEDANRVRELTADKYFDWCIVGTVVTDANAKITSFASIQPFHAVDRNDSSWIAAQAMPSSKYIDLTLGASGSTYTAPANGYLALNKKSGGSNQYAQFVNSNTGIIEERFVVINGSPATPFVFARKGDTIRIYYSVSGATNYFRFIYAEGEV